MERERLHPPKSRPSSRGHAVSPRPGALRSLLALGACLLAATSWCPAAVAQVVANPYLAVARFQGRATDELFYFELSNGRGRIADRLREPTEIRSRPLSTNLFQTYGRSEQPVFGDLHLAPIHDSGGTVRAAIFVEASTGYMAYVEDLGKGGDLGQLKTIIGRPFGPIRGSDGNYALMPVRDRSGATRGAYLYHGLDGKVLYVDDVQDLRNDPPVSSVTPLPAAEGWVSTAMLMREEQTVGYLIVDNAAGTVHRVDMSQGAPERLAARTYENLDLNEAFASDRYNPAPTRFVIVPLNDDSQSTVRILMIDTSTGKIAYLDSLSSATPTLAFLPQNLYQTLRPGLDETTTRVLTPVPDHSSSGRTEGVWLIDSLSGSLVYVARANDPAGLAIAPVRLER